MELKELYQEIILDHAKNPRNRGKCKNYNHDAKAHNPLCGDKVHIYVNLDDDKNIKNRYLKPLNSKKLAETFSQKYQTVQLGGWLIMDAKKMQKTFC